MRRVAAALLLSLYTASLAMAQEGKKPCMPSDVCSDYTKQAQQDYQLALAEARKGNEQMAFTYFHACISIDPDNFEGYKGIAAVYHKDKHQWPYIPEYWGQYLGRHPEDGRAYYERGAAYSWLHDDAHALADADKACSLGNQRGCQEAKNYRAHPAPWEPSPLPGVSSGSGKEPLAAQTKPVNPTAGRVPVYPTGTKSPSTITMTVTPNPSMLGQPVTVSFEITTDPFFSGSRTPTGKVVVSTSEGGPTCEATVQVGHCSLIISKADQAALTVSYEGDSNFMPHYGYGSVTVTGFSISSLPLNATNIMPETKESYEITLTSVNGFAGTIALSCAASPTIPNCSFSPKSVTLRAGDSATSTVTVQTGRKADYQLKLTFIGALGSGDPASGGLTRKAEAELWVGSPPSSSGYSSSGDRNVGRVIYYLIVGFVFGLTTFFKGFKVYREYRVLKDVHEGPIRSLAMGLVHFHGQAIGNDGEQVLSPLSHTPCLFYRVAIEKFQGSGQNASWVKCKPQMSNRKFYIQDESGRVCVDAREAEFDLVATAQRELTETKGWERRSGSTPAAWVPATDSELRDCLVDSVYKHGTFRFKEFCILPGQPYDVTGTCAENPHPEDEHDRNMIVKGEHDATFLISAKSENQVERWLRKRAAYLVFGGAALSIVCLGILLDIFGWL